MRASEQTGFAVLPTIELHQPERTSMSIVSRQDTRDALDATVPLQMIREFEHESLRWPPHLDHKAIVGRLVSIREAAPYYRAGLGDLERLLTGVEEMTSVQLAAAVLTALDWIEDNPGHDFLAERLQIIAVNLKNL